MRRVFDAVLLMTTTVLLVNSTPADAAQIKEVTFESQGETLVGNLYLPDDYVAGQELPGVVVTGSWTSVKGQMSDLYIEKPFISSACRCLGRFNRGNKRYIGYVFH